MNVWEGRGLWETFVSSFPFYCKLKTALKKIKFLRKKKLVFCNYLSEFFGNKI